MTLVSKHFATAAFVRVETEGRVTVRLLQAVGVETEGLVTVRLSQTKIRLALKKLQKIE